MNEEVKAVLVLTSKSQKSVFAMLPLLPWSTKTNLAAAQAVDFRKP
jgi:hypothetical protein